ncbi:MAG: tetratricopeptide repeat protein [Hyphomicrobiales bacterium]
MNGTTRLAAILTAATIFGGAASASDTAGVDAAVHGIALKWEHIKFAVKDSSEQLKEIDALAQEAKAVVDKFPNRPEPVIWEGIVTSEEAGMASMFSALGYAKQARDILERAYKESPAALDAGAPTSLGVLYYRVPGYPVGFGDKSKARSLLEEAVRLAPDGLDANYFYADFLMTQKEYAKAKQVLEHALTLPPHPDRPLWDTNRRIVMKQMIAQIDAGG